jgi:putative inorganic carbon (HCO3(-)) transporter
MRDFVLLLIVFGSLPVAVMKPVIGALVFAWVSLMNPHRMTWGFAYDMPLAMMVGLATILGLIFTKRRDVLSGVRSYWIILCYLCWMGVTTQFAFEHEDAMQRWTEVMKVHLMILVTLCLLVDRSDVQRLLWVIVVSLGFFGVKGGIFTLIHGGAFRVWGPPTSNITENNSLAIALLMIIPLIVALRHSLKDKWARAACLLAAALCFVSALGSHSRGALLASAAMAGMLWWRSRSKVASGLTIVLVGLAALSLMPSHWWSRMESIDDYQSDASALGRINTWTTAYRVANDRITGGGFEYYSRQAFNKYAPNPEAIHSAHSIYFQALGEHGWIGLLLFLSFWTYVWFSATRLTKRLRTQSGNDDLVAILDATKVSIVAFAVGGAFLNIGNWDGAYYIAAIVLSLSALERKNQLAVFPKNETRIVKTLPARPRFGRFRPGAS